MRSPAGEMRFATELALRMGFTPEQINTMPLYKVLIATGIVHAMRGKAGYFSILMQQMDKLELEGVQPGMMPVEADPREQERQQALAFYREIIANPDTTVRDKMDARRRIDELMGLVNRNEGSGSIAQQATALMQAIEQARQF